ncbi:sel1 repeat family protein, partial [Rhodobacteraceae bacterium]|nr:sel1 repeat family protein [Paracoccaceae bacterium]
MMHRFIIALSCFLMTFAAPISAQDFEKGVAALKNEDYAAALKEWKPLALAGGSSSQYNMGLLYHNGLGVPQDRKEAVKWYTLAAVQGVVDAQFILAVMYEDGESVL